MSMIYKANDIATFQQYLDVSFTFDINNKFPGLMDAQDDYLKPVLGKTLFDTVIAQANLPAIEDKYKDLVHLCRKVVTPLSVLLGLATKHIKVGDTGLKKTSSQNTESVFKWEYNQVREELTEKGAKALDKLWEYLYAKPDDITWTDPSPYTTIFKTGSEFNQAYSLHQPHRVFPLLKPVINKVEELFIHDAIGEAFLEELKAYTGTSEDKKKAIRLLRSAIAHFTIYQCIPELSVKKTEQGLTVLLGDSPDQPYTGEMAATGATLSVVQNQALRDGRLFMNKLIALLNTNADSFPTFKASSYYVAPPVTPTDLNAELKGIVRF